MIKNLILSAWLAAALSPLASLASPVDLESVPAAAAVDITSLTVKGESCQSHSTTLAPTGDVGTLGFDFFIATSGSLSCTVEVGFSFTGARNSDSTDISVDVTSHGFANLVSGLTGTVTQTVSVSGSNDVKVRHSCKVQYNRKLNHHHVFRVLTLQLVNSSAPKRLFGELPELSPSILTSSLRHKALLTSKEEALLRSI